MVVVPVDEVVLPDDVVVVVVVEEPNELAMGDGHVEVLVAAERWKAMPPVVIAVVLAVTL